jgi:hypothetical protein
VESLVPLAAPPEAQVAYAHANGEPVNELMHDYWDWTYGFVPRLEAKQLIPAAVAHLLHRIVARLSGPKLSEWASLSCEGAVTDPAWGDVRIMAQQALDALRARGIRIPPLSPDRLRRPIDNN